MEGGNQQTDLPQDAFHDVQQTLPNILCIDAVLGCILLPVLHQAEDSGDLLIVEGSESDT